MSTELLVGILFSVGLAVGALAARDARITTMAHVMTAFAAWLILFVLLGWI